MVTQLLSDAGTQHDVALHVLTMQLTTQMPSDEHNKEAEGCQMANTPRKHMIVKMNIPRKHMACAVLPRPISSARMDPVIPCCFNSIKKFTPTTYTGVFLLCHAGA